MSVDLFRRRSSLFVTQRGSGTCLGPINLVWDRCLSLHVERESISCAPPAGFWSTSTACHTLWLPAVPASQLKLKLLHFLCEALVNTLKQTRVGNGPGSGAAWRDVQNGNLGTHLVCWQGKYFRLYRSLYLFLIGHSWIWLVISICKWKMNNILYILCCETMHVNLKSTDSYLLCLMQNKERTL